MVAFRVLAGLDDSSIDYQSCEVPVHSDLVPHIELLRNRAHDAGFELALASGFRDFTRQLEIWNDKAEGRRPILDDAGQAVNPGALTEEQLLFAILRWSALPGASRHHWGTDIDVYDAGPCRQGYQLQLTHAETQGAGIFAGFHTWLSSELDKSGFFRPYQRWQGGVAPEPWHLSYAPVAAGYQKSLCQEQLEQLLKASDIALKEVILARLDEVFQRFVWVDWEWYPRQYS